MSNEQKPVDTRSASQKISDLENALMSLYQTADNMARDLMGTKEALKLLNNKIDSVIKASAKGEAITDEVINRIMIETNCEELSQKVKNMVAQGVLVATDQVADDSFLVGSEHNDAEECINPRLQFALLAIKDPAIREKLKGLRTGDSVVMQEGKPKYQVNEIYQIQQPKAPEAAAPAPAPAVEAATAEVASDAPVAADAGTPPADAPAQA